MTAAILGLSAVSQGNAESLNHCDRTCMTALVDRYLAALVKHDPAGLPLDKGVRFTENTATIRVGDGLWVGASEAPTTFKIYAVDPVTQRLGVNSRLWRTPSFFSGLRWTTQSDRLPHLVSSTIEPWQTGPSQFARYGRAITAFFSAGRAFPSSAPG